MPVWLVVVLMVLATYRLTRLVVADEFPPVKTFRERFEARHDNSLGYLVGCPFCVSVYAAGLVTFVTWLALTLFDTFRPGLPVPVLVWAGVAGAVSLLYELLPAG